MNGHLLRSALAAALVVLTLATSAPAAAAESTDIERFAAINREALTKY